MQNKVTPAESPVDQQQHQILYRRIVCMIHVGIDVAKDKHDCYILVSDGKILLSLFTIRNTSQGFNELNENI